MFFDEPNAPFGNGSMDWLGLVKPIDFEKVQT